MKRTATIYLTAEEALYLRDHDEGASSLWHRMFDYYTSFSEDKINKRLKDLTARMKADSAEIATLRGMIKSKKVSEYKPEQLVVLNDLVGAEEKVWQVSGEYRERDRLTVWLTSPAWQRTLQEVGLTLKQAIDYVWEYRGLNEY